MQRPAPSNQPNRPSNEGAASANDSSHFTRASMYALVAAASLMFVLIVGFLVTLKRGEQRLAELEAKLASQSATAGSNPAPVRQAIAPDVPALREEESVQDSASRAETARDSRPISEPQTDKAELPQSPGSTAAHDVTAALGTSNEIPLANSADNSTAPTTDAFEASSSDGDAYALPSLSEEDTAAASAAKSWFAATGAGDLPSELQPPVCAADRSLGTTMTWLRSPQEAEKEARKQGKLVFLIHVSGNFEDPGFT